MLKMDKKKILIIIRSIFIFLLFYNSYLFQYIPVLLFKISRDSIVNNPALQVILSTYSSLVVFCIIWFIYRKELVNELNKFKKNFNENADNGFKCWFTGLIIMFVSNFILAFVFKSGGANNEAAVQDMIKALPYIMGINVCLLAPFNEEIIFRKCLKDVFKNRYVFIALSFILFGGAHVISSSENIIDFLYIIPYGALGAAFACAYSKTDTVFTSMLFHMIHNTVIFLMSILPLL